MSPRLRALEIAAARLGTELPSAVRNALAEHDAAAVSADHIVRLGEDAGLCAAIETGSWHHLRRLAVAAERGSVVILLILGNGGAAVVMNAAASGATIELLDASSDGEKLLLVDEIRLSSFWRGEMILLRRNRSEVSDESQFGLDWLARQVLREGRLFRDVALATLVLSALALVPPIVWMTVADRVVVYRSDATLVLLAAGILVAVTHEMLLGHAQRQLVVATSARIDTRLNLYLLARLLRLPLDYFERNPAGEITHRLSEVWRVREFLTGKMFKTLLDCTMLLTIVPVLFFLNATLTWVVLACGGVAALLILAFLPAIRRATARVIAAETRKNAVLVETVHGIRTVKTLAIEPRQLEEWDERVAEAARARRAANVLGSWLQTLMLPGERLIYAGTLLLGAALAISENGGLTVGGLMAFSMLSNRAVAPLMGLAHMLQDLEEVRGAVAQASHVLNHPPERPSGVVGARPAIAGRIVFDEVTFRYPGSQTPALEGLSFEAPAGTLLGLVGRSGSGKSTVTRLLQAVSSGYSGLVKIDGVELREYDLTHLRRNLGVVLQDNFLFRGTIRENIAAGRPGMTFERIVRAARLAGAEEFIERMPRGYDTWVEEGSANLSGGQRQRLAIARALVTEPAILILDEATSALDPESEAIVNANLLRIARGRTVVIVSHRLSSLVDCDKILVLDRGRLLDGGRHEELLERCATYRQLWLQQHRGPSAARAAGKLAAVPSAPSSMAV